MIIVIIHMIISFFLDGFISNYISTDIINPSYLRTIYSVVSLVVIFNYFENKTKYLYLLVVLGILFDIVYTNTFLVNIVIFFVIYLFLSIIDYYLPNNLFTINLKSLISVAIYHIMSYLILLLAHYHNYNSRILSLILTRSIIMTVIYTTISYLVIKKIYDKKYDKRVR